jgi:dihydrolipoamide dehydrogenase
LSSQYQLIVIGGGPGGYVAAIRAAQLGMQVAVIEKRSTLGGTCLNVGCIPSKALLDSTELYHQAKEKFATHGISVGDLQFDLAQMVGRKEEIVSATAVGIDYLFKKNKIDRFTGTGSFVDANTIRVSGEKTGDLTADNIIIATGSESTPLAVAPVDGKRVITSTEALALREVPGHMVVIGGGAIGLELGSVFGRLGSQITVIEFMDNIIPGMDGDLGRALQKALRPLNFKFHLQTVVVGTKVSGDKVTVTAADQQGEEFTVESDCALVAVGRRPYTGGLELATAGIEADDRGCIPVNERLQTAVPHIYAVGDVIAGPMLAHKAEEEGVAVVEWITGEQPQLNHQTIPGVVYTWPEVAAVGKTEQELKEAGRGYKVGNFPFKASGRARAAAETDGFIKVLADAETDEILGVHMIGPRCADLIAEAVVAMEYRASAEDIGRIIHPHPTFTESFKEAALMATDDRALHF